MLNKKINFRWKLLRRHAGQLVSTWLMFSCTCCCRRRSSRYPLVPSPNWTWISSSASVSYLNEKWCHSYINRQAISTYLIYWLSAEFAASEPVAGLEDACLQYFTEIRQLLDLVMTWDWPTYFHDYGQDTSKYPHVNPNNAIILLEKWVGLYSFETLIWFSFL